MLLSVSQLKTFNASKATWWWKYLLGIDEPIQNDALWLWQLAEHYLITGQDDYNILDKANIQDMEKTIQDYDTIKHNAKWLEIPKGLTNVRVEWDLLGQRFLWYIDLLTEDTIIDIKTSKYLSKQESDNKNMWSWLSSYDEYRLQLWVYMKLTGKQKGKIIEVAKHKYKDDKPRNQIIDINMTEELDQEMTNKRQPVVDEMIRLWAAFNTK